MKSQHIFSRIMALLYSAKYFLCLIECNICDKDEKRVYLYKRCVHIVNKSMVARAFMLCAMRLSEHIK